MEMESKYEIGFICAIYEALRRILDCGGRAELPILGVIVDDKSGSYLFNL